MDFVLVIILLITPLIILQVGAKVWCIPQPSEDRSKDCGSDNIIQWQNITNIQIATKLITSDVQYLLLY